MPDVDISGKTVLITGGNSGIGKYTAIGLAQRGARVVFTSRNVRKGDVAQAEIRELTKGRHIDSLELDLASFKSIERFVTEFQAKYERLDILVLNAGVVLDQRSETKQGFETTFGTNHLGHFYLTQLLRDQLVASAPARVVVVASDAHKAAREGLDFDDLMSTKSYATMKVYGRSKLANILFSNELARQLEGTGVTSNALHPGVVRSGFGQDGDLGAIGRVFLTLASAFMIGPERGARTSVYVASHPELEGRTGGYYAKCREAKRTGAAQDEAAAKKLWKISEELIAAAKR